MPMIEVSEEDLKFIQELAHEMRTQDSCATANPRYISILTHEELIAPGGYGDREVYFDPDHPEQTFGSREEAAEFYVESEGCSPGIAKSAANGLEVFGLHKVARRSNFFLTRKGYDEHLRLNGHNLEDPQPYMEHAFRNPELKKLVEVIDRLGSANVT